MDYMIARPCCMCNVGYEVYEQTDYVIVHRQYYNEIIGKNLSSPYILLRINGTTRQSKIICTLGSFHDNEYSDIYMPTWMYQNISDDFGGEPCTVNVNTNELLTIEPIKHIKVRINMSEEALLKSDFRTNIETALTDLHTLEIGLKIPFYDNEEKCTVNVMEMEVLELKGQDDMDLSYGYIESMSQVTLDFEAMPTPVSSDLPSIERMPQLQSEPRPLEQSEIQTQHVPVPRTEAQAEAQTESKKELTSTERRQLVRDSWLKLSENT